MFRMNSERLEQIFDKLYIEKPWRICGADEVGTGKTLNHEVGQAGMSLDKSCYKWNSKNLSYEWFSNPHVFPQF